MMSVAVRVLGAIDVVKNGERLSVGGSVAKAILSLLIVRRGLTISADRLVADVWRDQAKPTTKHSLQAHISNLRKVLDRSAIVAEGGGYRIDPRLLDVDAAEFERLSRSGIERLRLGDPIGAETRLTSALELWRGSPYADVEHLDAIRAEIDRLGELHVQTAEARGRARADQDPQAALPEMAALYERHPDRESIAGLLMSTLYRVGRQADALDVYQQLRSHLLETRGIDPSPALQELELAILNQDPSLSRADGLARTNLTAGGSPPIGRENDIRRTLRAIRQGSSVLLIGPGGIGKSAIARAAALELAAEVPGGVWWVDLESLTDPDLACSAIAAAMALGADGDLRETLEHRLRADASVLVLDGAQVGRNIDPATVHWLGTMPVRLIVTARAPLSGLASHQVEVDPLPFAGNGGDIMSTPAGRLFVTRAHAAAPGLDLADRTEEVVRILERTAGVPLEIELAAARLRTTDLAVLASPVGPGAFAGGPNLSTADRESLVLLSGISGPFGIGVAEVVTGSGASESLARLEAAGVLQLIPVMGEPPRYRIVDSIRLSALPMLNQEPFRAVFDQRIITWAVNVDSSDRQTVLADQSAFRVAMARALDLGRQRDAERILQRVGPIWITEQGSLAEALVWIRRTTDSAGQATSFTAAAWLLRTRAAHRSGAYTEAIEAATTAANLAARLGLPSLEAQALVERGHARQFAGGDSRSDIVAGRDLAQSIDDDRTVARAQLLIAQADLLSERHDRQTIRDLLSAARIFRTGSDPSSAAHALSLLAAIGQLTNDTDRALELAETAVDLAEIGRDRSIELLAVYRLASVQHQRGSYAVSARLVRRAVRVALEIGHRALLASTLLVAASHAAATGDELAATNRLGAYEAITKEVGLPDNHLDLTLHLTELRARFPGATDTRIDPYQLARHLAG